MSVVGLSLTVSVGTKTGDSVLRDIAVGLEQASGEVQDFGRHVFPLLAPVFERAVERQFEARGGGPSHGAWTPLTTAYAAWKARRFPGMPLMERTGVLREALTRSSSPRAFREYSKDNYVFGTAGVDYASFFQHGTSRMVARPVFDFDQKFEDELEATALTGFRAALRATRLGDLGIEATGGP